MFHAVSPMYSHVLWRASSQHMRMDRFKNLNPLRAQVMLQGKGQQLDLPKVLRILCTAMIDNKEHVRAVGLEAMAVMSHSVGQQEFLQVSRASDGESVEYMCCVSLRKG